MPKMIVIEATIVNYADDRGGVVHDIGELIEPAKAEGAKLAHAGRALYVNKADDADKHGHYTASKAMIDAASKQAKV